MPSYGRGDDNGMADGIAHILDQASNLMKPSIGGGHTPQQMSLSQQRQNDDDSHSNDDSDSPPNQSPSPFSKESRRMRKYENDDISREKMARIYQEELAKLMSCAPRDTFPK